MDKERQRIVSEAKRVRAEIAQIFLDAEHWNNHVRTPFEQPIDPDPDGLLARMAKGLDQMIEREEKLNRLRAV